MVGGSSCSRRFARATRKRAFVDALNVELRALAARSGVTFLDLSPLEDEAGVRAELTDDGVHLNGNGYRAWQKVLEPLVHAGGSSRRSTALRPSPPLPHLGRPGGPIVVGDGKGT